MSDLKHKILGSNDAKVQKIDIPEWGGGLYIRVMTGAAREQIEKASQAVSSNGSLRHIRALMTVLTLCDSKGELIFTMDDIEAVSNKSGLVLERIFTESMRLNLIGTEEVENIVGESDAATD